VRIKLAFIRWLKNRTREATSVGNRSIAAVVFKPRPDSLWLARSRFAAMVPGRNNEWEGTGMVGAFGTRSRGVGEVNRWRLGLVVLAVSALIAAGAAWAQNGRESTADSAGRADDIVTQEDIRNFADTLVGKPSATPASPQELAEKAKRMATIASQDGSSQVQLGAARLNLVPPAGHCFLDEAQPSDARLAGILRQVFGGEFRMLQAFADCAQLRSWRTGQRKTLSDYGQFIVPADFIDKKLDGPSRPYVETICKIMRENGGQLVDQSAPMVKQRFEEALKGAQVNEMRFLGVVGQDDTACYFGLIQKLVTEVGDPKTQVDVSAIAFVSGKMIYSNLYAVHEGDQTLSELMERQQTNVSRNLRANGG
jgi:hypothetical protein